MSLRVRFEPCEKLFLGALVIDANFWGTVALMPRRMQEVRTATAYLKSDKWVKSNLGQASRLNSADRVAASLVAMTFLQVGHGRWPAKLGTSEACLGDEMGKALILADGWP
jgi:hypothetical protein